MSKAFYCKKNRCGGITPRTCITRQLAVIKVGDGKATKLPKHEHCQGCSQGKGIRSKNRKLEETIKKEMSARARGQGKEKKQAGEGPVKTGGVKTYYRKEPGSGDAEKKKSKARPRPVDEPNPSFSIKKHKSMYMAPEDAERLMRLNTYEAQRKMKDRNLKEIVESIDEGKWRTAEISIAVLPSGREVLVNGQHTLRASIATGETLFVFIVWYKVTGPLGLSELYRTFDLGRSARSIGDAVKAELVASGLEWPLPIASLVSTAAVFMETGSFRSTLGKAKQASLVRKYVRPGGFVVRLYEDDRKGFNLLRRAPVITAIVRTYTASPTAAWKFWKCVRDGDGKGPIKTLNSYLADQPETWDRRALHSKCVLAFNAWAAGKRLKPDFGYNPEADIPAPALNGKGR